MNYSSIAIEVAPQSPKVAFFKEQNNFFRFCYFVLMFIATWFEAKESDIFVGLFQNSWIIFNLFKYLTSWNHLYRFASSLFLLRRSFSILLLNIIFKTPKYVFIFLEILLKKSYLMKGFGLWFYFYHLSSFINMALHIRTFI